MNERRISLLACLLGVGCLAWCCWGVLHWSAPEALCAVGGMICLWAPAGSVVYLLLRDRCADVVTRLTLSWVVSYALTTAAYSACGALAFVVPGCGGLFYFAQVLLLAGALWEVKRRWSGRLPGDAWQAWRNFDGVLALLISVSVLLGSRYKDYAPELPDGAHRIAVHGDTTYLASLACELSRNSPPLEQASRSGLKERAYHVFPHLTTMLIARYTGQPDMLRALEHYVFTVVEILLCLTFFCIGRLMTGSRAAGYFCCALVYILAIPQLPLVKDNILYFYFTWHPHATSGLEPSILCSPQTYCALPVVMGSLLLVLQFSLQLSRRRAAGLLAILTALLAAATLRFRVQTFLILFPGVMLLLSFAWYRTRQRVFGAAVALGVLLVAAQVGEMRLSVYYPDSANLILENNMLAHRSPFMTAWPGAEPLRSLLQESLGKEMYVLAWQFLGLAGFAFFSITGLPVALASMFHFARPRSWRADSWAFTTVVLWLAVGTALGGTCLCTTYDKYSVGGQSLYLMGWYLLPLLAVGVWQGLALVPPRLTPNRNYSRAAGALLLLAAVGWQLKRPDSPLQYAMRNSPLILSSEEWAALTYMRDHLPEDAVVLFNAEHLTGNCCIVSSLAGRRAFFEYLCMTRYLTGGLEDNNEGRYARRDRVWKADSPAELDRALSATGATHLFEYARLPLGTHPSESLEEFWNGPTGQVKVWTVRRSRTAPRMSQAAERLASRPASGK